MRKTCFLLHLISAISFVTGIAPASAEQFVLFDRTFDFTLEEAIPTKSHLFVTAKDFGKDCPTDWTAPVDFRNGIVHVRLEVLEKPDGDAPTTWSLCYLPNKGQKNGYGCTSTPIYTKPGVYEKDVKMTEFWNNDSIVWTEGIKQMALVIKDDSGGKGHAHLRPDPEKFFPTRIRVTMVQVSKDATYDPTLVSAGAREEKKERPTPPTRPFDAPGAPEFTRLDGKPGMNPPVDEDGNFVVGPEYVAAPETQAVPGVPVGTVKQFAIRSKDTERFNPGIARDIFGTPDPDNPKTLIVDTHQIDYERAITVYLPAGYQAGTEAPFMVTHDGPKMGNSDKNLTQILDNLIAEKRIPPIVVVMIANGGGDAQGHERGREYDTMSGLFAEYIEHEVLPRVEEHCAVKLTKNPDGRATMGSSSGGSAALIMAWFHPEWYRRVLTTSGTFVNQQWPFDPEYPDGAWGFHETLIPRSEPKPLRIFLAVGDRDNLNPNVMRDGMHDWVEANHRMAKVLKEKSYHYQYLYCLDNGHGIRDARPQILPHALEWVWQGYPVD